MCPLSDAYFFFYYIVLTEILILNNCHKTNKRALCGKIWSSKKLLPSFNSLGCNAEFIILTSISLPSKRENSSH